METGAIPRRSTVKKVADYFGISVEEMMGYSSAEKAPIQEGKRKPKLASIVRLEEGNITPEMDKDITAYIDFLLVRERDQE